MCVCVSMCISIKKNLKIFNDLAHYIPQLSLCSINELREEELTLLLDLYHKEIGLERVQEKA